MALVIEQFHTEGIAQLSYLIGDDAAGVAAVVDPRRDVGLYIDRANTLGLRIGWVIETHIHADFVSGARALAARTGAKVRGGPQGDYSFPIEPLESGERIALGDVSLEAVHTPGHTPEHVCLLVRAKAQGSDPFAILTGDTLLNLAVGRPDLLGDDVQQELARDLYRSLSDRILPLGADVEVLPGHTAGSACAPSIGHRRTTTVGAERGRNPFLRPESEEEFVALVLGDLPEPPRHYARLKKRNGGGPEDSGHVPDALATDLERFCALAAESTALIVDTRSALAFGGGHIPGALHLGFDSHFTNWAGWMIEPSSDVLLVTESAREARAVIEQLYRIGIDRVGPFLAGGMKSWVEAARPIERVDQWTVGELATRQNEDSVTILDVRSDREWQDGHIPGARHIYLPHLTARLDDLDRSKTIATYCGSGYRASIGASVLQRAGFDSVASVPGSMNAWNAAGLPLQTPPEE